MDAAATAPAPTKRELKRAHVAAHNKAFEKRLVDPIRPVMRGMAKYRALLWQLWRLEHDKKALLDKEPKAILKSQLVEFRPSAPEPTPDDTSNEDARDAAAVIAADPDAAEIARDEEDDVRATAERFAFRWHQKCRGRGYLVKGGRAVVCKCAARKMAAYLRENDVAV